MRKDTKSLLLLIVVISIAFGFAWCCSHKTISSHRTYKQECHFGGISIDMILLQQLIYLKIVGTRYRPRRIVLFHLKMKVIP